MIQSVNDSTLRGIATSPVTRGINCFAALTSGAFGVLALASPSSLVGQAVPTDPATSFYVDIYVMRSIVIAVGIVAASLSLRRTPLIAAAVLAGGGLVQVGDVVIAERFGTSGVVGASIGAVIHLGTAAAILAGITPRSRRSA